MVYNCRDVFSIVSGLNSPFRFCFQIGDRIIEVDGVDLRHSTHERAVEVIQAAGNPVSLVVQSLVNLVRSRMTLRNIDVSTLLVFSSLSAGLNDVAKVF